MKALQDSKKMVGFGLRTGKIIIGFVYSYGLRNGLLWTMRDCLNWRGMTLTKDAMPLYYIKKLKRIKGSIIM